MTGRLSSHVGMLPTLTCQPGGLPAIAPPPGHHHPEQHSQLGHVAAAAAAAAAAASMGMESSELMAVAHYQAQQLQRQLLAEQSGPGTTMLPPTSAQPTGGGLMQPQGLQGQQQPGQLQPGQDPLQSLVQQLLCLQQIEYFLAQRGHK